MIELKTTEYIEREALIAEYDRVHKGPAGGARKLMVDAPACDVVEVRHGEWEILLTAIIDTIGKCTNCGGEAVWRTRLKPYTLCPHCGAKMDGGSK